MKILFSASPARGHVYPMLPLLRAAQRDGHDVVLATATDLAPELERAGIRTWTAGPTFGEAVAAYREAEPGLPDLEPNERIRRDVLGLFAKPALVRAEELVPQASAWQPDLVVSEATELAAPAIAAITGASHLTHGLGQAPAELRDALVAGMDHVGGPLGVRDLAERVLAAPYLDIMPPSLQPTGDPIWSTARPLRPTDGEVRAGDSLPAGFDRLLDGELAYLTMGTLFNDQSAIFRESVAGLVERGLNVLVTVGPGADPGLLGSQPDNVLVVPFVPQALVLPHVSLVVHHGGAGTTLGSFVHGLPQLIAPQGADQFMNAATATEVGAARTLMPGTVTAEAVSAAVDQLLTERRPREVARRVQAEIAAMPSADAVLADLVSLEQLAA